MAHFGLVAKTEHLSERWWRLEDPSSAANEVCSLCDALEKDFVSDRARWEVMRSQYEPRFRTGQEEYSSANTTTPDITYPISRSLVDTVIADIAGRQRPKPLFMTSGADWKVQRKAKKRGRFVVGQMSMPQDEYLDAWEVLEDGKRRACVYGIDWVHVYGDSEDGRVRLESVRPEEILYDKQDASEGSPNNLFRVRYIDEDELLYCYVTEPLEAGEIDEQEASVRRAAIARGKASDAGATEQRITKRVRTCEAWRLPGGEKGRHVLAIENCLVVDEEWERPDFPFLVQRWARELDGFGGIGLVEESYSMACELQHALQWGQEQMHLNAGRRIFYTEGSVDTAALQSNESETLVPVQSGSPMPTETNVPALNQSQLQWIEFILELCHRGTGVSQMAAQGRKEPGVTAAVAMRTMIDLATKRFSLRARDYENTYIRLAELIVSSVQELVRSGVSVRSRVKDSEFLEEYDWADVGDDEEYTVQIDAVSAQSDSATGRLATLQESVQSGFVTPEAFSRIAPPEGTLDIEDESGPISKQQRYMSKLIDKYLDADEKDDVYEQPEPFLLDVSGAVRQWIGAYFDSKYGGAPEHNLQLLRDYIAALDRLVQKAAAAMQAAQSGPVPPQQAVAA
jgi:hypothetical protein